MFLYIFKTKEIFLNICDKKYLGIKNYHHLLKSKWSPWEQDLPSFTDIVGAITNINEKHLEIELHLFGDAGLFGTSAVANAVIKHCPSIK